MEYTAALHEAGALIAGEMLQDGELAATVRVRQDKAVISDGPCPAVDSLVGFYVVDLPDLDSALRWARRVPARESLAVEVRPVESGPASGSAFLKAFSSS